MPAAAVQIGWEVAEDDAFRRILRAGKALARPELAHSVHVEITGLICHRRYWYGFVVDGMPSHTGPALTVPAASATLDPLPPPWPRSQPYLPGPVSAWHHPTRA